MRISNFEFGTVKISRDLVSIQIPKSEFKYDTIEELQDIKTPDADFLNVAAIKEIDDKGRVDLSYEIPQGVVPFENIKKEELIVKLSIAKTIVENDKLKEDMYVSIHPSTLFYRPMKTVKYTYRANHLMPQEKQFSNFERYKALVLSIVSGLSYEICLKNKERLDKVKNELVNTIMETKSRQELLDDLEKLLEYNQYSYFKQSNQKKKSKKFKRMAVAAASLLAVLLLVGMAKSFSDKKYIATIADYETQIEEKEEELKFHGYIAEGDFDSAAKSMKKAGKTKEEIADMYLDAGLYQKAIDINPKHLDKVIAKLYQEDQKDAVLDLEMDGPELDIEKKIVSYDYAELKSQMFFVENPNTLLRMGKAFVDHGDIEDAQMLQETVDNKELGSYITLKQKEAELQKNKEALDKIKGNIKEEKDEKKKDDLLKQEKTTTDKIKSLEKEIDELKNKE